jgi:hypothetical protein
MYFMADLCHISRMDENKLPKAIMGCTHKLRGISLEGRPIKRCFPWKLGQVVAYSTYAEEE